MERRRILRAGLCLWGLALPLSAAPSTEVRLRVAAFGFVRLSPMVVEVMTTELNRLLAPAGTRVEWRWATPGTQTAPDELCVVFLDSSGRGAVAGQPLLGTTATGGSDSPPVTWIYWRNVVHTLGFRDDSPLDTFFVKRSLGVALGRVVAHELVHALAPEVPHGTGLMEPGFTPGSLPRPRLDLDERSAAALGEAARSWQKWGGLPPAADRQARARLATAAAAEHAVAGKNAAR